MTQTTARDGQRLREFWNRRYAQFTLSESGWWGAGERLNDRLYDCKLQALRRSLAAIGITPDSRYSVLDAGCGQGSFAAFYRDRYPHATYVGVDISDRVVAHLQDAYPAIEFHAGDLCSWRDPRARTFDVVQSFEVLHMILDDAAAAAAIASLASMLAPHGTMLLTAPLPEHTINRSDYLRYRSRVFWEQTLASLGLRIVSHRPIYYWLPAGGPANKYLRYALTRLGADALYAIDRAALALGRTASESRGPDCQTLLLTVRRA